MCVCVSVYVRILPAAKAFRLQIDSGASVYLCALERQTHTITCAAWGMEYGVWGMEYGVCVYLQLKQES